MDSWEPRTPDVAMAGKCAIDWTGWCSPLRSVTITSVTPVAGRDCPSWPSLGEPPLFERPRKGPCGEARRPPFLVPCARELALATFMLNFWRGTDADLNWSAVLVSEFIV